MSQSAARNAAHKPGRRAIPTARSTKTEARIAITTAGRPAARGALRIRRTPRAEAPRLGRAPARLADRAGRPCGLVAAVACIVSAAAPMPSARRGPAVRGRRDRSDRRIGAEARFARSRSRRKRAGSVSYRPRDLHARETAKPDGGRCSEGGTPSGTGWCKHRRIRRIMSRSTVRLPIRALNWPVLLRTADAVDREECDQGPQSNNMQRHEELNGRPSDWLLTRSGAPTFLV
jgi:hypothetical protein